MSKETKAANYINSKPDWEFSYVEIGPGTFIAGQVTTPAGKNIMFQGAIDSAEFVAESLGEPTKRWNWRN